MANFSPIKTLLAVGAGRSACFGIVFAIAGVACPAHAETSLFDGESLSGWTLDHPTSNGQDDQPRDHWRVQQGCLIGENPDKRGSILWTDNAYRDFEITLEYRTPSEFYDSGVFLRGLTHQAQIGISNSLRVDRTACLYAPIDGRGPYPAVGKGMDELQRPGDWNELRVIVTGPRIRTYLNGQPMVDYQAAEIPASGPIGLQVHAGHHMKLYFRNLRLRTIDGE